MFGLRKQLNPPPIANKKGSQEILRFWANVTESQELVIEPFWKDPGNWGIALVDIARHLAKAYAAREKDLSESEVLARIQELFDAEWSNPTDTPKQLQ